MNVISLEKNHMTLSELAKLAKRGTVIVTSRGEPLLSVNDLNGSDWECVSLANNPKFIAIIEESRRQYREKGGIPMEKVRKDLGLPARRRARKKARTKR
jgi:hypothetical protein